MIFASPGFLFLFLPLTLLGYAIVPKRYRNFFLLIASLFFYAWGETFYVFIMISSIQAMSYLIDVYRKESPVQKNIVNCALYISLFPQLIAGPIVRYHTIAKHIVSRRITSQEFSSGIQRFILGLTKKVILANPLGEVVDKIFTVPHSELTPGLAWFGIICYSFQIYFDFSGYSDMAIGLGRMFGFHFLENFNYPYISQSIQEFWRRWHLSLIMVSRLCLYSPWRKPGFIMAHIC